MSSELDALIEEVRNVILTVPDMGDGDPLSNLEDRLNEYDAARLSHDRGADGNVEALQALIEHGDWEESEGGTVYVGPGEVVVSVATLRAALSVPAPTLPMCTFPGCSCAGTLPAIPTDPSAPTLPALDAERAGKALDSLDIIDGIVDDTHPEGHGCPLCHELDNLREVLEALRDAV